MARRGTGYVYLIYGVWHQFAAGQLFLEDWGIAIPAPMIRTGTQVASTPPVTAPTLACPRPRSRHDACGAFDSPCRQGATKEGPEDPRGKSARW